MHRGCGVFGGEPVHKFMQQVVAAAAAKKTLAFSSYGDEDLAEKLKAKLDEIDGQSLKQIWDNLQEMKGPIRIPPVASWGHMFKGEFKGKRIKEISG